MCPNSESVLPYLLPRWPGLTAFCFGSWTQFLQLLPAVSCLRPSVTAALSDGESSDSSVTAPHPSVVGQGTHCITLGGAMFTAILFIFKNIVFILMRQRQDTEGSNKALLSSGLCGLGN